LIKTAFVHKLHGGNLKKKTITTTTTIYTLWFTPKLLCKYKFTCILR
jgi:hypothetical protein